jgi:hypothetical protein
VERRDRNRRIYIESEERDIDGAREGEREGGGGITTRQTNIPTYATYTTYAIE